jgi:hypothetical protein
MQTLLLSPRYTPDSIALGRAALASGWDAVRLPNWRPPPELAGRDIAVHGEPLFAAVVAQELRLALLEPTFGWLADLPETYRLRQVRLSSLGEARGLCQETFLKPADDKCFAARVYASGAELPSSGLLPGRLPVLIAEPVRWKSEFRCFVLERQVVTLSVSLRDGRLARAEDGSWPAAAEELEAAWGFASQLLADPCVSEPPAVVLDVGLIAERGWAVVEANAAWGSGLYGCEPARVLPVLARACLRKDGLALADAVWVRPGEA